MQSPDSTQSIPDGDSSDDFLEVLNVSQILLERPLEEDTIANYLSKKEEIPPKPSTSSLKRAASAKRLPKMKKMLFVDVLDPFANYSSVSEGRDMEEIPPKASTSTPNCFLKQATSAERVPKIKTQKTQHNATEIRRYSLRRRRNESPSGQGQQTTTKTSRTAVRKKAKDLNQHKSSIAPPTKNKMAPTKSEPKSKRQKSEPKSKTLKAEPKSKTQKPEKLKEQKAKTKRSTQPKQTVTSKAEIPKAKKQKVGTKKTEQEAPPVKQSGTKSTKTKAAKATPADASKKRRTSYVINTKVLRKYDKSQNGKGRKR